MSRVKRMDEHPDLIEVSWQGWKMTTRFKAVLALAIRLGSSSKGKPGFACSFTPLFP